MNSLPIDVILQIAGITSLVTVALSSLANWMFKSFFGEYLGGKGKNLATKQDVAEITRRQEEAKLEVDEIRERLRSESQMRVAAVEKRFEAHQQAHTLWFELWRSVHHKNGHDVVMKCQRWWYAHSLYLEPEPRAAFKAAYMAAADHPTYLKGPRDQEQSKTIRSNWRVIMAAGEAIERAVKLPPLAASELTAVDGARPSAFGLEEPKEM